MGMVLKKTSIYSCTEKLKLSIIAPRGASQWIFENRCHWKFWMSKFRGAQSKTRWRYVIASEVCLWRLEDASESMICSMFSRRKIPNPWSLISPASISFIVALDIGCSMFQCVFILYSPVVPGITEATICARSRTKVEPSL
jgi:hypothetical protein